MSYPAVSFADWLSNATREELEQLTALLQGYLSVEHNEEGKHTAITATSVTTTGDATIGGDASIGDDLTVTGDLFVAGEFKLSKGLALAGEDSVTTPGSSGDLDSLNTGAASVLRISSAGGGGLAGIPASDVNSPAGQVGRTYLLLNDTSSSVTIQHDSASASSTSHRFYLPSGQDMVLRPDEMIAIWYDSTDSRWRVLGMVHSTGTWTPAVSFGGSTTGVTYSTQVGEYTRVGNLVTVTLHLVLTSNGSGTGSALIGGLPFASDLRVAAPFNYANCALSTGLKGVIVNSDISVQIPGATGDADATQANITDTAVLLFGATYRI